MILAAFDAARLRRPELKPRALITGLQCSAWKTLPRGGGYFDQPAKLMLHMSALLNIYSATEAWINSQDWAEFSVRRPQEWAMIQNLIMLRQKTDDDV